jgi:hypothetical protein
MQKLSVEMRDLPVKCRTILCYRTTGFLVVDYHKVYSTCGIQYCPVESRPNLWIANYMECQVILWTAELPCGLQKYLVELGISCVMQDKKAFEIK